MLCTAVGERSACDIIKSELHLALLITSKIVQTMIYFYLRGSGLVFSPVHDYIDWCVSYYHEICRWQLQYSFQFILNQLSYIVWGTNGIIKYTITTRECVYLYSLEQWDSDFIGWESYSATVELYHKNVTVGGFPGFESAVE